MVHEFQKIRKILVANRGEIALRIMRTGRELGIRTVAVYSDADRKSAHVRYADEAYRIGAARATDSYLHLDRIMEAVCISGADALHPGYGFLSERAALARACAELGICFIGPSAHSIEAMGDKTGARQLMQAHDVPVVPGTPEAVGSLEEALATAEAIGYPVLAKAAAGGGGKGMRRVDAPAHMEPALALAQGEAAHSFGDARIFIEKLIECPRHIEVQVLADHHGDRVHLYERECSIQRRHQKVIEEAPACVMTPDLREAMGDAALRAAQACDYVGAGTIEFLLDPDGNFYFMEMNTRLQVEHPVTEWITGLDLVAEQIRVAEGHKLAFDQADLRINGHAIECRIYAEDPAEGFMPDAGSITHHRVPVGVGVRVDAAMDAMGDVPLHYDPMIAKVAVWGRTRTEATRRMIRALGDYHIAGVKTTSGFCRRVMESSAWQSGALSTHFVDEHLDLLRPDPPDRGHAAAVAAALLADSHQPMGVPKSAWWDRRRV